MANRLVPPKVWDKVLKGSIKEMLQILHDHINFPDKPPQCLLTDNPDPEKRNKAVSERMGRIREAAFAEYDKERN